MNVMIKAINQTITFLLEITMLFSFGYFGMVQSWSLFPKLVCSIALIVFTVFIWSVYAAPKSVKRLEMPLLAIFRAILFLIASCLLFQTGQKSIALILAGLAVATQIMSFFTEKSKTQ